MIYESVGRKQLFSGASTIKHLVTVNFLVHYCLRKSSYIYVNKLNNIQLDIDVK